MSVARARGAALPAVGAAALLAAAYLATLAPGPTFWDAGEFLAATATLGVPHPPGTPLYVLIARAWSVVLAPFVAAPVAVNALSALATAAACGAGAWIIARATGSRGAALAAGITAGSMASIWMNATETEVYALSLLLLALMLACAWRAREQQDGSAVPARMVAHRHDDVVRDDGADAPRMAWRWIALAAYLIALAVPLHMSALVGVPAVVAMLLPARGTASPRARVAWRGVVLVSACALAPVALAAGSLAGAVAGVVLTTAVVAWWPRAERARAGATAALTVVALSALIVIPLRAAHDPFINAGNATSLGALWDVVRRKQYGGHSVWPRLAPLWAQFGNLVEYFDWQVALGLAPGVAPDWARTPFTVFFAALGIVGLRWHRAADRRSWLALLVLFLSATAGLVLYLNFKAGTSYGYGVLPPGTPHEARERDYFFAPAFWCWGLWAGTGAYVAVRRIAPRARAVGVMLAALPLALNTGAMHRRRWPDRVLPLASANALLGAAPPRAVLLVAGDNDTFPLWYLQSAEHVRPDVAVVTVPLLGAAWYRAQLLRRDHLSTAMTGRSVLDEASMLTAIGASARAAGRPVAAAITLAAPRRAPAAPWWVVTGPIVVNSDREPSSAPGVIHIPVLPDTMSAAALRPDSVTVDTAAVGRYVTAMQWLGERAPAVGVDPAAAVAWRYVVQCPRALLSAARSGSVADSLATLCNLR
ncbi:MAG TPA: DUF2723 domain-containing protein [Gemmatimonadaceae bacterium]|nr:DUF2723 domain-containing protein [Gemmatimonadaceae bacterium]